MPGARTLSLVSLSLVLAVAAVSTPAVGQAPKYGGILNLAQRADPAQGFAIHETGTIDVVWPASPCFNNLVYFDPLKKQESLDTIVGDLAEKWSWQDNYRNLVFFLRRGVKWHDGTPFTSKDVKYTFDMIREAPDAQAKLRINPRKAWYANVEAIEAADPYTVVFRLKRPQPSLIAMLASGYSPVYPAHVPPAEFRTRCVGTGPFKLKELRKGEYIDYVKNPDYFIKGRPYLDGLRFVVNKELGTRVAAVQAGQLDASFPGDVSGTRAEALKKAVPQLVITKSAQNVNDNLIMNTKKPPFDQVKVRLALSLAIDRAEYVKTVHQGTDAIVGASMAPKPYGVWGLLEKDVKTLPGYGKAEANRAQARKLLAEAGFTASDPLRVEMGTRAIAIYVSFDSFVVDQLKRVGVEAQLRQFETAQGHPKGTRRDYELGANLTGIGPDDPDANFFENYSCGSPRNYADYCDEQVMKMMEAQSQELDPKKRLALVWQIQKKLELDVARPVMGWRIAYHTEWAYVKNLVPHQSIYNWARMQEVWLDK